MALKTSTSSSPLKSEMKNIADGNLYASTLDKKNIDTTELKTGVGSISESPSAGLKTSSGSNLKG